MKTWSCSDHRQPGGRRAENAAGYEEIERMNRELEQRVEERTAELRKVLEGRNGPSSSSSDPEPGCHRPARGGNGPTSSTIPGRRRQPRRILHRGAGSSRTPWSGDCWDSGFP
jgi:C4-dicarboxylate-specific signal transduction histidine kinase